MLLIANSIMFGILFAIWSKKDFANILFKIAFLTLLIFNILQAAK